MKDRLTSIRTGENEDLLLEQAAAKYEVETGRKGMKSRVILHSVEEFVNKPAEMFFCNRDAIRSCQRVIDNGQKALQGIFNEFKAIGVKVTLEDIAGLFGSGRNDFLSANQDKIETLISDYLFEAQRNKYPGLQFSMDNVVIPDLTPLFEAASKLGAGDPFVDGREVFYWSVYTITQGQVVTMPEKVETVKNYFRCFASTPEELKKLATVQAICDAMNVLTEDKKITHARLNLSGVFYFDTESQRFEPSEAYIKFGLL